MLHDPAVPVHLHSKLLSVLGQCHSSAASDVLESIKKLLSGSILKNPVSGSDHAFSIDCCRIGIIQAYCVKTIMQFLAEFRET